MAMVMGFLLFCYLQLYLQFTTFDFSVICHIYVYSATHSHNYYYYLLLISIKYLTISFLSIMNLFHIFRFPWNTYLPSYLCMYAFNQRNVFNVYTLYMNSLNVMPGGNRCAQIFLSRNV